MLSYLKAYGVISAMKNNRKRQRKSVATSNTGNAPPKIIKTHSREHLIYLRKQQRHKSNILMLQVGLFFAFIFLWEISARYGIIDAFITSSPSRILKTIVNLIKAKTIWIHISTTLLETVIGFVLSTIIGTAIALLLWYFNSVRKVLDPYIVVINSLPKIALGPIILIWFGSGIQAIIVMTILISVVITIIAMLSAFLQCDQGKILLMNSMGASKVQMLTKLVIPSALPSFISVLKINVGMAWVGSIMGEYLVSAAGLGYLIQYGGQVFNLDLVMANIVILCVLAALMYYLVALTEKLVIRWQ